MPSTPDDARATTEPPAPTPPRPTGPRDKVRLRFEKAGALRLLSHHDLMRTFERMLRRAGLPFASSQGFHPKPRLVFALSLPLGVVGREEVAELELAEPTPPEEVGRRLAEQAPPGITIRSARRVDVKAGAQVRRLCYALDVPAGRLEGLAGRLAGVLAAAECRVSASRTPPSGAARAARDVRPFLRDLRLVAAGGGEGGARLEIDLSLTPSGTARPDEVLTLLGLSDLPEAGCVVERTRLELSDEMPPQPAKGNA